MSRSNPSADKQQSPVQRWLEWKGSKGHFEFYDKVKKESFSIKPPFVFIVLDQTATIRGYNKRMKIGIYSNEVRDTRAETLVVKFFNGETIAEGFYTAIKEKAIAASGHFVTNCYVAFKDGNELKLGCIQFQGCSLGPWFEFVKNNREEIYKKAVCVKAGKLETSGSVQFYPPVFSINDLSAESDSKAKEVDAKLQEFLKGYFGRTRAEQVSSQPAQEAGGNAPDNDEPPLGEPQDGVPESGVPF
jgi:hypothetical protein